MRRAGARTQRGARWAAHACRTSGRVGPGVRVAGERGTERGAPGADGQLEPSDDEKMEVP